MADFSSFCALVAGVEDAPWIARFDMPGFGTSPALTDSAGSLGYAGFVAKAISQVVSDMPDPDKVRVIVIGHSFGGRVALALTDLDLTEFQLAGLLISGVPLLRDPDVVRKPKMGFRIARFMSRFGLISNARMESLRTRYGSSDYRNAVGVMREVLIKLVNEDYRELLANLRIPVSLFWGIDDQAAPLRVAERAVRSCPDHIELRKVQGDHFVALTMPALLLESAEALVQRTKR